MPPLRGRIQLTDKRLPAQRRGEFRLSGSVRNIGIAGLGKVGSNLALNIADHGLYLDRLRLRFKRVRRGGVRSGSLETLSTPKADRQWVDHHSYIRHSAGKRLLSPGGMITESPNDSLKRSTTAPSSPISSISYSEISVSRSE